MDLLNQYAKEQAQMPMTLARPQTLSEQLEYRKKRLESDLSDINEAIAALDSNPEILKALEAVQKVSRMM